MRGSHGSNSSSISPNDLLSVGVLIEFLTKVETELSIKLGGLRKLSEFTGTG